MTGAAARTLPELRDKDVGLLKGVGQRRSDALAQVGITSVLDLLTHYPRRYIDRTRQVPLSELAVGEEAAVLAEVRRVTSRRTRRGQSLVEVEVSDGVGYLRCSFFNQPWRAKQLAMGRQVVLFGRLELYRGRRHMTSPVLDLVGDRTGRIVPVYPQSDKAGLTTWELGDWIAEALRRAGTLADPLPEEWKARLDMLDRADAIAQIHAPESLAAARAARRRLAFDELLRLQVVLVARKAALDGRAAGISHAVHPGPGVPALVDSFLGSLAFDLTCAQRLALEEIMADLAKPHPMHRLLQGDVGSGKTVVALATLLAGVQGGHQGALMAPTEVLAEQHYVAIRSLLGELGVPDAATLLGQRRVQVGLLTNRTAATERSDLHSALRSGSLDILVGTHALLTEEVGFASLGVVVVDEQHRFGVEQRSLLRDKGRVSGGRDPDMLVMTATPIPRTAAMTVFGDLDSTVLRELPAGRTPVATLWARGPLEEETAWARVREEAAAGHQAYVVCPLVEGSERVQARSATEERERLEAENLSGLRLGLLHGQMPAREKEAVMEAFRRGETEVLVATTVVEVGVDVANATVMVVEDADRFGLAQLHQLRGRVGRSSLASWCYLLGGSSAPDAAARLEALERTTDGFELAEVDLELRGEGTILGTRQKGRSDLKLASLRRDQDLVVQAREVAIELVGSDPTLSGHPLLADEIRLTVEEEDEEFLFKS